MLRRARSGKWSLMVIRGADKNVKQFQVSKRSMIAAPAAALLAVSGCFITLQMRSAHLIGELEEQLEQQSSAWEATVEEKDSHIEELEENVAELSEHTEEMKAKLQDLYELESRLKSFIETYGGEAPTGASAPALPPAAAAAVSSITAASLPSAAPPSAGETADQMIAMLNGDEPDFRQLTAMINDMEEAMEYSLKQAKLRQAAANAVPTGWPTTSKRMTSGFGYRTDPFTRKSTFHAGIDIAGSTGDAVFAAADGTVTESGYDSGKGNYIIIKHRRGLQTVYMHLSQREAKEGESVVRGEKIGLLGSTGRSTGPHLHFEIMQHDEPVNPLKYLRLVKED
ncbi:peptidoglycan DD-metalloendopeptidase family protein [Paenibacillus tarimensis]|nr:peptidoglycan DD-metalloendopeptidase family protein [Paenibacillus tarimensis]